MWCPQCQADVATEVAADGQSLLCTACGVEIRKVFAPSLHPETRSARELLERWAAEELLDEPAPPEIPRGSPPERTSERPPPAARDRSPQRPSSPQKSEASRPKFRIDAAHSRDPGSRPRSTPEPRTASEPPRPQSTSPSPRPLPRGYRQDVGHERLSGPHFDVPVPRPEPAQVVTGRSESLWGQLLAYAGVGVLTIGTVLVLWGHFGALANYASTGWLVATGGQMLLFLGVVTLVSGGMQQTTHEVTRRVEHIGERMVRIEQSTLELLHAPHFNHLPDTEDAALPGDEADEG